jgi:hypothetical protein
MYVGHSHDLTLDKANDGRATGRGAGAVFQSFPFYATEKPAPLRGRVTVFVLLVKLLIQSLYEKSKAWQPNHLQLLVVLQLINCVCVQLMMYVRFIESKHRPYPYRFVCC